MRKASAGTGPVVASSRCGGQVGFDAWSVFACHHVGYTCSSILEPHYIRAAFLCMAPAENDIPATSHGKTEVFETVLKLAIPFRRALHASSRWQERVA